MIQDGSSSSITKVELQLQEAHFSSLISTRSDANFATWDKPEPDIKTQNESIEPSKWFCIICTDEKSSLEFFKGTRNCTHHYYCTECTAFYLATKIRQNTWRIKCPDLECTELMEPYTCQDLIPKDVFERWDNMLCESLISSWDKFYCPYKDCLAMMVDDGDNANVTETECPACHRLFCVECNVTWHAGIGCEEFQGLGNTKKRKISDEEDDMLIQMAKSKQWMRCPNCKIYVDKVDGCLHINCRCGFEFCYGCGSAWGYHHVCGT